METVAKTKDIGQVSMLITFTLFMAEAMIHYNIGAQEKDNGKAFILPPKKDLVKIALVVGTFSVINGLLVKEFTK